MACARSGSIFCWPRAVVFLLLFFREFACFDLPLWAAAAVLDLGCLSAGGCDAGWGRLGEVVVLAAESFAAAFACFFGFAVFVPPVFLLGAVVCAAAVCASALPGEIQTQI